MSVSLLIADDSPSIRTILRLYLMNADVQIHEATNGREALEVIAHTAVDLAIVDLNMPEVDGLEFTKRVRGGSSNDALPILLLTANRDEEVREWALKAGVTAFVNKPVSTAQLQDSVSLLLRATGKRLNG